MCYARTLAKQQAVACQQQDVGLGMCGNTIIYFIKKPVSPYLSYRVSIRTSFSDFLVWQTFVAHFSQTDALKLHSNSLTTEWTALRFQVFTGRVSWVGFQNKSS